MKPAPSKIFIGYFGPWIVKNKANAAELTVDAFLNKYKEKLAERNITFEPEKMKCTFDSVSAAVTKAKPYDRAMFVGETLMAGSARLERLAYNRKPVDARSDSKPVDARSDMKSARKDDALPTSCPVEDMAKAAKIDVSDDAGWGYCNYVYYLALKAKVNAVFLHVNSGFVGIGRNVDVSVEKLRIVLEEWVKRGP
jgi:pyrrolidone-carboxylate peptidase